MYTDHNKLTVTAKDEKLVPNRPSRAKNSTRNELAEPYLDQVQIVLSRGSCRKIVADWPCRARIMSRLSRATVMPAKAKAEAELTRAVRRHRQISTSQAKSVNLSCGGRSPIKGPVPTEDRNIVVNRRLGWQPTAGWHP